MHKFFIRILINKNVKPKFKSKMDKLPTERVIQNQNFLLQFFESEYIYGSHILRKYIENCGEFLKLSQKDMKKMTFMYLKSTEYIINHCFISMVLNGKNRCGYFKSVVNDYENTIGNVFDKGYLNMLKTLLNTVWNDNSKNSIQNTISINGIDIKDIHGGIVSSTKIAIKKVYLNAFITHFLKNSLSPLCDGGHRGQYEGKNIAIEIDEHSIRISDVVTVEFYSESSKKDRVKKFENVKDNILNGRFNPSHKTISSFIGLINLINHRETKYDFQFGFNNEENFFIELMF